MAELQADPEWSAQNAQRESSQKAAEARFREEEASLVADLAEVGLPVDSVWDLVNSQAAYPNAIPVLLRHLRQPYHDRIRNGIIRAVTVPEARGLAGKHVLSELRKERDPENRWALANALTIVADRSDAPDIERFLGDPHYEDVSERLMESLKSVTEPR